MSARFIIILLAIVVLLGAALGIYMFVRPMVDAPPVKRVEPVVLPALPPPTTPTPTPTSKPAAPKIVAPTATPEPTPTAGTLIFETDVPDTGVFIDRVYVGQAPITAKDVKPGSHTINVSATGYDGIVDTIDVAPGTRTLSYKFKEIHLDATVAVVHKHAIGSCTGTLHATPQGLTYDTTNKDDAFTVPLTNLETFAVDYLQKNLRVKIKNGKTFNFTDPNGNADKLYAFQTTVEKVRQRIMSAK